MSIMKKGTMKTPNYDSGAEKEKQDSGMYAGTGADGVNGNSPNTMSGSVGAGAGNTKTTGDGPGHWSKH